MSIASELTRIETAKSNLKTSIEGKGVTVPSTATLDAYPTYVDSIQQGGGSSWVEIDNITPPKYDGIAKYVRSVELPNTITSIGEEAFKNHSNLTSVNIPSGVTSIGQQAFYNCSGLTSVNIPSGVTRIEGRVFEKCYSLASADIPSKVSYIGDYAFSECTALTSATIPSGVTTLNNFTFYSCTSLRSIVIPNNVSSVGNNVFDTCSGLTSVTISSSITTINNSMFDKCYSLLSVDIPSSVTKINPYAFNACRSLTSVTIPSNVSNIGDHAFYNCSGMTSIDIQNGVTKIDSYAFQNCSSLQSITIPSSVTSIGYQAFYNCSGLTSITVNAVTPPTLNSYVFTSTNNCPIYVPSESVETYKAASGWSTYASRIQAIPQPATWELVTNMKDGATKIKVDYSLIPSEYVYANNSYSLTSDGVNAAVYYADSAFIEGMSNDYGVDFSDYEGEVILVDGSDSSTVTYMLTLEDGVEYDLVSVLGSSVDIQTMANLDGYYLYAK